MYHKDIKLIVRKQLKKQFPNWKSLSRKEKKEIAQKVLSELVAEYDFKKTVTAPKEDLLGIEQQMPNKGIINLDAMAQLVDTVNKSRVTKLSNCKRSAIYIKDKELQFIDELLDDRILNRLLANEGYSPAKRDLFPNNFFRAELLKAIKFPEISYRKFCTEAYLGLDQQQNRVFIGLPLNKKDMIDHTQLSKFRTSISFVQQVNLLVYILALSFRKNVSLVNRKKAMFGKNIIITDNTDWMTGDIIEASLARWQVEDRFRISKDDDLVGTSPLRHWTDSKIRCHLFTCVVAMTYLRRIELKMAAAGRKRSIEEVMDDMRHLQHYVLSVKKGRRTPERRLETPSKTQSEVLSVFGYHVDESGVLQGPAG